MKKFIVTFLASFFLTLLILHSDFVAFASEGETTTTNQEQRFPDVEPDAWFYPYVEELAVDGIVQGYPDGRFGAWDPINRAEFAKIVVLLRAELQQHWLKDNIVEIILVLATVFGWVFLLNSTKKTLQLVTYQSSRTQPSAQQHSEQTVHPDQQSIPTEYDSQQSTLAPEEQEEAIEKNLKSNWWV